VLLRVFLEARPAAQRRRVQRLLQRLQEVVLVPSSGRGPLLERLAQADADLVVVSRSALPSPWEPTLLAIRELPNQPEMIVVAEEEDPQGRAALLAAGCRAVLFQGLPDAAIIETFRTLIGRQHEEAVRRLRADRPEERYSLGDFVTRSPAMRAFMDLVRRVVHSSSSLLILGETGVGKERLARAVHSEGPRSRGPFIAVNCGALPEGLLEAELFGHEEGAFTGATRARRGYFELAHRGTLFLDEIADLPLHLQVKLLRALQERKIQRVGGERPLPIDVRVMAATNRTLDAEVAAKRFRADLYYRLAVVTLSVPALRDRREDVPSLVADHIEHFRAVLGRHVTGIQEEALQALLRYEWPGNVRELINVIERAVLLCSGSEVGLSDLPPSIAGRPEVTASPATEDPFWGDLQGPSSRWLRGSLGAARREAALIVERRYLAEVLRKTGGRIAETARHAGITERSLYDRMTRHGLKKEVFRPRRDRG